jgi:hypothetical protein
VQCLDWHFEDGDDMTRDKITTVFGTSLPPRRYLRLDDHDCLAILGEVWKDSRKGSGLVLCGLIDQAPPT